MAKVYISDSGDIVKFPTHSAYLDYINVVMSEIEKVHETGGFKVGLPIGLHVDGRDKEYYVTYVESFDPAYEALDGGVYIQSIRGVQVACRTVHYVELERDEDGRYQLQ